jgi:hypothetical protein
MNVLIRSKQVSIYGKNTCIHLEIDYVTNKVLLLTNHDDYFVFENSPEKAIKVWSEIGKLIVYATKYLKEGKL